MKDKNGLELKVGDEVRHPSYSPTGRIENNNGDVRVALHGYEANAAHLCEKLSLN